MRNTESGQYSIPKSACSRTIRIVSVRSQKKYNRAKKMKIVFFFLSSLHSVSLVTGCKTKSFESASERIATK